MQNLSLNYNSFYKTKYKENDWNTVVNQCFINMCRTDLISHTPNFKRKQSEHIVINSLQIVSVKSTALVFNYKH